ncbi:MAG TPA: hypothetical protein DER64_02670, partial [Planctomycetaceae bacterium]|nr:hypothetical protein [Planctomycetaceae bacterium]
VKVPRFETLKLSPAERPSRDTTIDTSPVSETAAANRPAEPPPSAAVAAVGTHSVQEAVRRDGAGTRPAGPIYGPETSLSGWKRFRRWFFRAFFESRAGMAVLLGTILIGTVATWWIWQRSETQRHEGLVAAAWDKADVAFRQAQFDDASVNYQEVVSRAQQWGTQGGPHVELAQQMIGLADRAEAVSAALAAGTAPLPEAAFADMKQSVAELLEGQDMPPAGADMVAEDDPPVGLDFTTSARVSKLVDGWLVSQAERMAAPLADAARPQALAVDRLEQLAGWLDQWGRDTTGLRASCEKARERIQRSGLQERFTEAGQSAMDGYSADTVLAALAVLESWQKAGGGEQVDTQRAEFLETLAVKLKEGRPLEEEPDGNRPLVVGPPVVALAAGSAKPIGEGRQVVYVNDEDQLLALDAETGVAGWAVRRGFTNGWLPANGRAGDKAVCVVSWRRERRMYLSCLECLSGIPVWTRRMPVSDGKLSQPPIVHKSSVLVPTEAGLVVQLDLVSGKTRSRVRLPESLAARCVLNVEKERLACLGRELGTYTLGLSPALSIEEVHVRDGAVGEGQAHVAWAGSLLLAAINLDESRCRLVTYRLAGGQLLEAGEALEFDGNFWQPPSILGDSAFLATDSGQLARLVLSPASPEQPVKKVWSGGEVASQLGSRPYVLSHAEAPLLMGFGGAVTASFLEMGGEKKDQGVRTAWTWSVPDEGQVVFQPLQLCPRGVVIAVRQPGKAGVFVNCLDLTSGRQQWTWSNGGTPPVEKPTEDGAAVVRPSWSLVVAHFQPVRSLDPWNAALPLERELVPLLFDRLLQPGGDGARYIKGPLVDGYELLPGTRQSAAGAACRVFRFRLKSSRSFHDGQRMDSEDVVESIRRLGDARVRWGQREQFRMLRAPRSLADGRVEVMVRPYLATGRLLSVYVAPRRHYANIPPSGSALSSVPVGSGRFEVVDRLRADEIVLRRSRHHAESRRGEVGVQEVVLKRFKVSAIDDIVDRWQARRVDMIAGLGAAELAVLKAKGVDGDLRLVRSHRVAVLMFNHRSTPFTDPKMRHKVVRLVGPEFRREVLKRLGGDQAGAVVVGSVIPSINRAAEAALPDGLVEHYLGQLKEAAGGRSLSLKVVVGNQLSERAAAAIAGRLTSMAGARVNLVRLTADRFHLEVHERHSFDLAVRVLDYSDPLLSLGGLMDTRASKGESLSLNVLGFGGQQLMQSLVDFRMAQDWTGVLQARRRLDDVIRNQAVVVPLWSDPQYALIQKSIRSPAPPANRCSGPWLFHRLAEWSRGT